MAEIFNLSCERWSLTVRTRDNATPRRQLSSVLDERGKLLPSETIRTSFLFSGTEQCVFENKELPISIGSKEIGIPWPLCYENHRYVFEITFKKGFQPDKYQPIRHRLTEIETCFDILKNNKTIVGSIDFQNNIGWFKFGIQCCREHDGSRLSNDELSFRVYPTKMDMETDLNLINMEIDHIYPLWRFVLARKTNIELSRTAHRHELFELFWLAQFKSLAQELKNAVTIICRSPHNRLVPCGKMFKAQCITGRMGSRLEERIKEDFSCRLFDKRYLAQKRKLSQDTPENRFVKMVLNRSVRALAGFSAKAKNKYKYENAGLSETFFEEINTLSAPFERLARESLFREVGHFEDRIVKSLVLQQQTGYANVYRIWQQLRCYLDWFGSDAAVSIRSVESLYELWCLLEIRKMLMDLGFTEKLQGIRKLKTFQFEKTLKNKEIFNLERIDGLTAVLIHEPQYRWTQSPEFNRIYSWTTTQRPDIFLEITYPNSDKVRWIFDAKYRIDAAHDKQWPPGAKDTVPDDAVNQMHRYRDALFFIAKADEDGSSDKSRPVVGAFALYPGWYSQHKGQNPYRDAIETVGIGAFPLIPGQKNCWLQEFFRNRLGKVSKTTCEVREPEGLYLQDTMRIPPSGMQLRRYEDLLLAAYVYKKSEIEYLERFINGTARWYHIPESTIQNYKISRHLIREIKYCAFFTPDVSEGRICRYIYPVESAYLRQRQDIDAYTGGASQRGGHSMYWLFALGSSFPSPTEVTGKKVKRKFSFRLIRFKNFIQTVSWDDLYFNQITGTSRL